MGRAGTGWIIFCLLLIMHFNAEGQGSPEIELFGGITNYQGDLQPMVFTFKNSRPGWGVNYIQPLTPNFLMRAGLYAGRFTASDADNKPNLQARNLSVYSRVTEVSLGLEARLFDPAKYKLTPYGFLGIGYYRFNPYAYHPTYNGRVYLQPLSTEGQGLPGYEQQPYKLSQFSLPYAFGIRWQVSCKTHIALEFKHSKLFTDYLDDVSTTYPLEKDLLAGPGRQAADLSWRTDELNGTPYPTSTDVKRGNPRESDWFYFAGLKVGINLGDCGTNGQFFNNIFNRGGSNTKGFRNKKRLGNVACPDF